MKKILLLIVSFFFLSNNVYATKYITNIFETSIETDKNIEETSSELTATITIDATYNIGSLNAKLDYDKNKIEFVKCESSVFNCSVDNYILLEYKNKDIIGKTEVAKLYFKKINNFIQGEDIDLSLTEIEGNNNTVSRDVTTKFHIIQKEVDLTDLIVENEKMFPVFDKKITAYKVVTKKEEITIKGSFLGNVEGLGLKKLNLGNNIFEIITKSDIGTSKKYIINVFREYVENMDKIDTEKTTTKINQATETPTKNESDTTKNESDTTKNESDTTKNESDTTKQNQKVTSNNIKKKLSSNKKINYLTIKNIDFTFDEKKYEYNINVKNIKNILFNYELQDKKSKLIISGDTFLKKGLNNITISIIAEDGSQIDYLFNITNETEETIEDEKIKEESQNNINTIKKPTNKPNKTNKKIIAVTIIVVGISSLVLGSYLMLIKKYK